MMLPDNDVIGIIKYLCPPKPELNTKNSTKNGKSARFFGVQLDSLEFVHSAMVPLTLIRFSVLTGSIFFYCEKLNTKNST